ncbi:hypothetical protein OIU34_19060 [Pararhizobium sp. BT-229]|uniref:hypothetical protein n=1 Tax=Pararhizobium sp. BT-229 TaxID=2986923 RepID=UPI0021F7C9E7|nr:hypothetical protein [Pararhizobium sp. BT-229]MCV9963982.1 hypothetical protein [Pararhizobium sp. BT-229]
MKASASPSDLTFTTASGAVGIEGFYDPLKAAWLTGVVRVDFTARLAGSEGDPTLRLRTTEKQIVAEVLHRLMVYEALVAERDSLLEKVGKRASMPSSRGFSTAEIMFAEDISVRTENGS